MSNYPLFIENEHFWTEDFSCINLTAPDNSDFYCPPDDRPPMHNGLFCYVETDGNFVIRAKCSMQAHQTGDGVGLMAYQDDTHWIKCCLEEFDNRMIAIATVVTNGVSDDAIGSEITQPFVWLQIARKGDVFVVHYSLDGMRFLKARACKMLMPSRLRVGLLAQAPRGKGDRRSFEQLSIEHITISDISKGR